MSYKNKTETVLTFSRQSGAALLIAMVVLASMAAFYLLGQFGAVTGKLDRQAGRVASLSEAKKALIAFAVTYYDANPGKMGFLPCPDTSAAFLAEGIQHGNCGFRYQSSIGRLPWSTLGIPPLRDDANECLWYIVSGDYKTSPEAKMLNEDTNGLLSLYNSNSNLIQGVIPEDRVVAMVIAPNAPVGNQIRNKSTTTQCGDDFIFNNYLDDSGVFDNSNISAANTVDGFIQAGTGSDDLAMPFNDRFITITRNEIWNAIKRRNDFTASLESLTSKVADCVVDYGNDVAGQPNYLPWPAEMDLSGADYRDDLSYADVVPVSGSLLGRLADDVGNSQTALSNNSYVTGTPADVTSCRASCQDAFVSCQQSCGNPGVTCKSNCRIARDSCEASCPSGGTTVAAVSTSIDNVITSCLVEPYLTLWKNWKDHFFYVVSGAYAPDSADVSCSTGSGCVSINGNATKYAGLIFFAGEAIPNDQERNDRPDSDTKQFITNYLEGNNASNYPDADGNKDYDSTAGNDVLFCISEGTPLTAAKCP